MACKNCLEILNSSNYCSNCGAKVVKERTTVRILWNTFTKQFIGWDNKYLQTVKGLVMKPQVVLKEYLDGTRKKYVAPFVFIAIGTAIAMLIFNTFSEQYLEITDTANQGQFDFFKPDINSPEDLAEYEERRAEQLEISRTVQKYIVKYFNLFTLLLIPLYGLIAYLVFRKPYNYAEHLIISCYLQGLTFLFTILFFVLSLFTWPGMYFLTIPLTICYYLYAYAKLYKHKPGKILLNLLKFIGIVLLIFILLFIIGVVFAILIHLLTQ